MNNLAKSISLPFLFIISLCVFVNAQVPKPTIIDVVEDDRVATIYWNSKTYSLQAEYDQDKRNGVFSYMIEWGPEEEGFIHSAITPYRITMVQPLEPGITYTARVYNLDKDGRKSEPSEVVSFQHDPSRVNDMRLRLNGFFEDFNTPMGAFSEKDWNQAYSGCMKAGRVSQHINNQFHAHNVLSSNGGCDRGVACSRLRHNFDFTDRTGIIEFDLDGSQRTREFWYLDLMPAGNKRDLTGHIQLHDGDLKQEDPPHLLRILEKGSKVAVQIFDADGYLHTLQNVYENACGDHLEFCEGENLSPLINVRRRWRIELSKRHIKILINEKVVVDGSLETDFAPDGLAFEKAQINWLTFSYNTIKENFLLSMIHWDNFGFDAPTEYEQSEVVHNYTDGKLGTESPRLGNDFSVGMVSWNDQAGIAHVRIPDQIMDVDGNLPLKTELLFTMQGSDYQWNNNDRILINGNEYFFPEPTTTIAGMTSDDLMNSATPYAALLEINPAHLITGDNEIAFYLNRPKLLNIHVELTFPIDKAPNYTPPQEAYDDHLNKLMAFWDVANTMGPGIIFNEIDSIRFFLSEFEGVHNPRPGIKLLFEKQTPVSGNIPLKISANSEGQLAATGKAKGIAYYEVLIDSVVVQTIRKDLDSPVAFFQDHVYLDTEQFENGLHELFIRAYDVEGNVSTFDRIGTSISPGQYIPVIIDIQNTTTSTTNGLNKLAISIFPNPNNGKCFIQGELGNYQIQIFNSNGILQKSWSALGDTIEIDMDDLPEGLYFAKIVNAETQAFVVKKIIRVGS